MQDRKTPDGSRRAAKVAGGCDTGRLAPFR
jgi:hypothetical protein